MPSWFELRGVTLALAWFCLLNVVAGAAVAIAARWLTASATSRTATVWFGLRMFPAAAAMAFVAAVFLPSYWRYEPRDTNEGFELLLIVAATLTVAAFLAAVARGVSGWRSAARRTHAWMLKARPLALSGTSIPAFEIDVEAPVLALVGVLRPRMLVTRGLIAELTADELAASIAHEIGHARAWDNLKRLAMRSAPDVLPRTDLTGALERQWAAAAEHRADHAASHNDPGTRCALASALLKVARRAPQPPPLTEPLSTLVSGGDIASRVRRLLDDRTAFTPGRAARWVRWIAGLALALAAVVRYDPLLRAVHEATEILVRSLP